MSQPFAAANHHNNYVLATGQSDGQFQGTGWTLSGGAQIVKTTLPDGGTGEVLDLPSGAKAVSPPICVTAYYPTARTRVRNVVASEGVFFYVSYQGTSTQSKTKNTG